jgi:hypothetical protein
MKNIQRMALALCCAGSMAQISHAGAILQPLSATSSMGSYSAQWLPTFAINQSGITPGYTSGVTDFDSYVAAAATTNAGASSFGAWFGQNGVTTGDFDFDLGSTQTIESFALWNDRQTAGQGINGFRLYASNDAGFASATQIGTGDYTAAEGLALAQVYGFAPVTARYVRLTIVSNHGSTITGFSEAAFELAEVPVPAAGWVFASGLLGLAGMARRRTH